MKKYIILVALMASSKGFSATVSLTCDSIQNFYSLIPGEGYAWCQEYEKACKMQEFINTLEKNKNIKIDLD